MPISYLGEARQTENALSVSVNYFARQDNKSSYV